ncbi:MAG TPA: hypothetical protein VK002_15710 [Rubricoccaceae bacterium]|jgi:hypothetical protein|nr:hypothetical protein [Rubricoccaceae bacterium]
MQGTTNDAHEDTLDQTIAALEAGPTALDPATGLAIVNQWYDTVLAQDDLDLGDVADGLAELRDLLAADALDGAAIGEVLLRLGEATQAAAQQAADERLTPMLERLATLLSFGGDALSGGRARSTAAEPDQGR